jgi:hypothetical protein
MSEGKAYLSVWSLYQDEAPYMREWIEFHRLVGVERFYLYDHDSVDDHREALAPYIDDGVVVLHDWPIDPGQVQAANHCLENYREQSRWIAFIDLDEFLFSPAGLTVPEVLADYEQWPGVVVNVAVFGTSGHQTPPDGLVIENYLTRSDDPKVNGSKKSIVDPARVVRCRGGIFDFSEGLSVNEDKQPSDGRAGESASFSRLRINHYHTKSEIEYERKIAKPRADRRGVRFLTKELREQNIRKLGEARDEALLGYAPAVRDSLRLTEERRGARADDDPGDDRAGRCETCGRELPALDPQAILFARDVLMGVAVCAEDGAPYPLVDLVHKAAALLDPRRAGRPASGDGDGPAD